MMLSVDMSASSAVFSSCFVLNEPIDTVERDASVVADDPATAVRIGQPGEDVRTAALADVGRVGVEYGIVVSLAVFREGLDDGGSGS